MKAVTAMILGLSLSLALLAAPVCGQQKITLGNSAKPAGEAQANLHLAALQGDIDAVRERIEAGSDLNQKDMYGSTPLIIAVTFGRAEVVRALVDAGADMEIASSEGATPLFIAAFLGRSQIVRFLLDSGANRFARNIDGASALDIVSTPFEDYLSIYDQLAAGLAPLGLQLDYEAIRAARPAIAEMLRPSAEELDAVDFTPLPADGWETSVPADQGLEPQLVAELYLDASHMTKIYGLILIKNGRLIAEGYFNEGAVDKRALLQSVSKSYVSALVGIALDRSCLSGLDEKMMRFFPDLKDQVEDPRKDEITVRQLLEMRAGYPWEESDPKFWDMLLEGNYPPLMVDYPLLSEPGSGFNYSNLSTYVLGAIVSKACETDLKSFAVEYLLSPIGSEAGEWWQDQYGNYYPVFSFTARDAARFGLLYLDEGEWRGTRVIPADWVAASLRNYSQDAWVVEPGQNYVGRYFRDLGYGYQWWSARVGELNFNFAWGHGGQLIVLLDHYDMVIVVTTDPFWLQHDDQAWTYEQANFNLVGKFIQSLQGVQQ